MWIKEKKNELLDVNNLENNKMIEWSHLSTLMTLENLNNEKEINQSLLDEIGENFKSTFKYEKDTIKTEEKQTKGDKVTWKENKDKAQTHIFWLKVIQLLVIIHMSMRQLPLFLMMVTLELQRKSIKQKHYKENNMKD